MRKRAGQGVVARAAVPGGLAAVDEASLLTDLRSLIQAARQRVATVANATQTMLYWHVGRRLLKENLLEGRAAYGKRILATVSQGLAAEFGDGFSYSALTRMVRFAETIADEAIVVTLSQQLSWSHFHALLPLKDPMARDFYAEMCRIERWDVRTLRQKIGGTVEFLGIWESVFNPDFNYGEFAIIKSQAGLNSYKISVQDWVRKTNAIGLNATAGRYGGTFAHLKKMGAVWR